MLIRSGFLVAIYLEHHYFPIFQLLVCAIPYTLSLAVENNLPRTFVLGEGLDGAYNAVIRWLV